jgi:hypothetical protein
MRSLRRDLYYSLLFKIKLDLIDVSQLPIFKQEFKNALARLGRYQAWPTLHLKLRRIGCYTAEMSYVLSHLIYLGFANAEGVDYDIHASAGLKLELYLIASRLGQF